MVKSFADFLATKPNGGKGMKQLYRREWNARRKLENAVAAVEEERAWQSKPKAKLRKVWLRPDKNNEDFAELFDAKQQKLSPSLPCIGHESGGWMHLMVYWTGDRAVMSAEGTSLVSLVNCMESNGDEPERVAIHKDTWLHLKKDERRFLRGLEYLNELWIINHNE